MTDDRIVFDNVSRFYGEVLGVNRINLSIPPGITSLVGPNGSGKSTLMNLMAGLIRPSQGTVSVLGLPPTRSEQLFRQVGYVTQYDSFPKGLTGYEFIYSYLLLHGIDRAEAERRAWAAIERVNLTEAARRRVAGYSKGMRQRVKLAQGLAHDPRVMVLDEPLNGLDPMARAETLALFRELGKEDKHVIVSSHILHEIDQISDQVILLSNGYIVAEGEIQGVRSEVKEHPMQILVRCERPGELASRLFREPHVVEAKLHDDGKGLSVRTRDADTFYLVFNKVIVESGFVVEKVAPADEDAQSVYEYLIGGAGGAQ